MMRIEILVLLMCLLPAGATTTQETTISPDVAKEDSHFLMFEWEVGQPYSARKDWLKRNQLVFDHADYCTLWRSFRYVGPNSSGRGSGLFALSTFLVLREIEDYDRASRMFHDEVSGLNIKVSFDFPPAEPPDAVNKKGVPPQVFMSLSLHRAKDDPQSDVQRSEVSFIRDTRVKNGLTLTKLALVGDTEYRYGLACSEPREMLRSEEQLIKALRHRKH